MRNGVSGIVIPTERTMLAALTIVFSAIRRPPAGDVGGSGDGAGETGSSEPDIEPGLAHVALHVVRRVAGEVEDARRRDGVGPRPHGGDEVLGRASAATGDDRHIDGLG